MSTNLHLSILDRQRTHTAPIVSAQALTDAASKRTVTITIASSGYSKVLDVQYNRRLLLVQLCKRV